MLVYTSINANMKISQLKNDAKIKLSGKWGLAVAINLVHLILTVVLTVLVSLISNEAVSTIVGLLVNILLLPFSYGLLVSMIKLSRNENTGLMDFVTIGLENIVKVLKVYLWMILKLWLPLVLFIVSGFLLGFGGYSVAVESSASGMSLVFVLASAVLLIVAMIVYIVKLLSYSLPLYLLWDNPEATSKETLNKSAELMKGNKFKLILLELSFIGWTLLIGVAYFLAALVNEVFGLIILFAGALLLEPYKAFTGINFYEDLAGISDVKSTTSEEIVE